MSVDRSNPIYHENVYRPIYEIDTSLWYFAAATITASNINFGDDGNVGSIAISATAILTLQGVSSLKKAGPLIKRQYNLFFNKITFENVEDLRLKNDAENFIKRDGKYEPKVNKIYIGDGFEWGVEHANRSQQIQGFNTAKDEIRLPLIFKPFKKKWMERTQKLGGKPWIQGLGDETKQYVNADAFFGHSMIMGNVGTGKTTLFTLMSLAMIHKGYTVIVLDPKNDTAWRKALQREMEFWGKGDDFHYFHPSQPTTSCKIDPIKNWNRATEIAERIASIMVESGKEDSFVRFNWNVINSTVNAMLYSGISPQIKNIARYATSDKNRLAIKCLEAHYEKVYGNLWESEKKVEIDKYGKAKLERLINHYDAVVSLTHHSNEVSGIISLVLHNAEHMQKMTANLLPIFSVLTAKPLDDLISPETANMDEGDDTTFMDNSLVDTADIVENGGVLYMALDSLSDTKTAGYLSKLILADIAAVAGARYNFSEGKGRRVAIFVDEVHAAIAGNEALLNLLAQGRAAWMQMFIATQTKADLESKTDKATADRLLGLCNNFFSMRANDSSTQEYASKQFGEVPISTQQITLGQSSGNTDDLTDFGSSYSERLSKQNDKAFSESLLGSLPTLQYIARLADGRTLKARIPVVK
jgi:conjugal transfer pilus assembly protein TraD